MSSERASAPWQHSVRSPINLDHETLVHVDRDPCPKCGIRGDLGCKHKRRK